jgi:hypothetical protein
VKETVTALLTKLNPHAAGVRTRQGEKPGQVVLDVKLDWRRGKPNFYLGIDPYISPSITAKVTLKTYSH